MHFNREPRFLLTCRLWISTDGGNTFHDALSINISRVGVGFYSARRFEAGTPILARSNHFSKDREGIVRWNIKINEELWRMGVQFLPGGGGPGKL